MPKGVPESLSALHAADAARRCGTCGYDVRGIGSQVCPECGDPIHWQRLVMPRSPLHERALEILRAKGIAMRFTDFGVRSAFSENQPVSVQTAVWIPAHRAGEAIDALDDAGILIPIPIIDIDDATCPTCASPLDVVNTESCGVCGSVVQWIDVCADLRPGHRRARKAAASSTPTAVAQRPVSQPNQHRLFLGMVLIVAAIALASIAFELVRREIHAGAIPTSIAALLLGAGGVRLASRRTSTG